MRMMSIRMRKMLPMKEPIRPKTRKTGTTSPPAHSSKSIRSPSTATISISLWLAKMGILENGVCHAQITISSTKRSARSKLMTSKNKEAPTIRLWISSTTAISLQHRIRRTSQPICWWWQVTTALKDPMANNSSSEISRSWSTKSTKRKVSRNEKMKKSSTKPS